MGRWTGACGALTTAIAIAITISEKKSEQCALKNDDDDDVMMKKKNAWDMSFMRMTDAKRKKKENTKLQVKKEKQY